MRDGRGVVNQGKNLTTLHGADSLRLNAFRFSSPYRGSSLQERTAQDFEQWLIALDAELEDLQKTGKALVSASGQTRAAVKVGRVADIARGLKAISQRASDISGAADDLANSPNFDAAEYLGNGRFTGDLQAAAREKGVVLFENDGRIYCFPLLLRVDPKELGVKIGKTLERRIRPSELVRLLLAEQKRPQRFREEQFLEVLYRAWRRLAGAEGKPGGIGQVVSLAEIHDTLTLLPGTDYPAEEFARDLLLLDRKPELRTRDGSRFEFAASSVSKGKMKRLVVYDEQGGERAYFGIRFVRDA